MDIKKDLVYSWNQNNKVTLYLLDNIENEWLNTKVQNKGRTIGEQFVHINNIRSYWINKVGKKEDLKINKKNAKNRLHLIEGLQKSSERMNDTLFELFESEIIKGFRPHPAAFFTQVIAHEAHHRGQIMTAITKNDLEINKSVNFGLWSWNSK